MSSKGRSADGYVPDPHGFFSTQPQVARAILPYLGIEPGMKVLEPSCGNGAIGKVLRRVYGMQIIIIGVEIDKKRAGQAKRAKVRVPEKEMAGQGHVVFDQVIHSDFYKLEPGKGAMEEWPHIDRVITNPDFGIWLPFSEHCFKFSEDTTLLLPFNALASKVRQRWWKQHPAHAHVLSKRPSFAISVKCFASTPRGRKAGHAHCDFQELIALDEKPKTHCPLCGTFTITTRSDSSEYMWARWNTEITRGLWDTIETPEPHPDDA